MEKPEKTCEHKKHNYVIGCEGCSKYRREYYRFWMANMHPRTLARVRYKKREYWAYWYSENKDKLYKQRRENYAANPEKYREYQRVYYSDPKRREEKNRRNRKHGRKYRERKKERERYKKLEDKIAKEQLSVTKQKEIEKDVFGKYAKLREQIAAL